MATSLCLRFERRRRRRLGSGRVWLEEGKEARHRAGRAYIRQGSFDAMRLSSWASEFSSPHSHSLAHAPERERPCQTDALSPSRGPHGFLLPSRLRFFRNEIFLGRELLHYSIKNNFPRSISFIRKEHWLPCLSETLRWPYSSLNEYRFLAGWLLHRLWWLGCTPYPSLVSSTWSAGLASSLRAPGRRWKRYNVAVFP